MADGTLRISFDVEPMHAQDAFRLFASPGTPAALAALQVGYASKNNDKTDNSFSGHRAESIGVEAIEKVAEKPKGGALAKLAGMWCADPEFQLWAGCGGPVAAKQFILDACEIESRVELDHNQIAAENFHKFIRGPYSKHLIALGVMQ